MKRTLQGYWWYLVWLAKHGTTLDAIPEPGQAQPLVSTTCLHSPGCWSYCTGGYRYCLCCGRVRVLC